MRHEYYTGYYDGDSDRFADRLFDPSILGKHIRWSTASCSLAPYNALWWDKDKKDGKGTETTDDDVYNKCTLSEPGSRLMVNSRADNAEFVEDPNADPPLLATSDRSFMTIDWIEWEQLDPQPTDLWESVDPANYPTPPDCVGEVINPFAGTGG